MRGVGFLSIALLLLVCNPILGQTNIEEGDVFGTWNKTGNPYLIKGDINIPSGEELLIDPGVEILFLGHYQLNVRGSLKALGTINDSIVFRASDVGTFWHSIRVEDVNPSENDSTILEYCRIENTKYLGGGVGTAGGNALFTKNVDIVRISNCLIRNNYGGRGGGVYCDNANIKINNNWIIGNSVTQYGGGMYVFQCSPIILNNTVEKNYGNTAGGLYFDSSESIISNNIIIKNSSYDAGGGIIINESDVTLYKNIIAYNVSNHDSGGGLVINSSNPKIANCTVSYNRANLGEGIYIKGNSSPEVVNSIIYSNQDRYTEYNQDDEIYFYSANSSADFFNCDIQSGINSLVYGSGSFGGEFENIFDSPPLFADTISGDLSLTWTEYPVFGKFKSPCIDAGKFDSPHDRDGSIADVGAHYFHQNQKAFEPRPEFSADTVLGFNQLQVQFIDLSDPGSGSIISWHWNFGDGDESDSPNPSHLYESQGLFDVSLTVKDVSGFEVKTIKKKYVRIYEGTYIKGNVEGELTEGRYLVGGEITVDKGKSLTIDSGSELIFFGNYGLKVLGSLKALGTLDNPIHFSLYDTTGFNFESSDMYSASAGWEGINIYMSGVNDSTIIDHSIIEFVKNSNQGAVRAFVTSGGGIRISNSEVRYNLTQGISTSSKIIIKNNYVHHNHAQSYSPGAGICVSNGNPIIINNIICSNKGNEGGGIAILDGYPQLINNVICHNVAGKGGGVYNISASKIINNTISFNSTFNGSGGAGYYAINFANAEFINTIIAKNLWSQVEIWDPGSIVGFRNCILEFGKEAIGPYQNVSTYENVLTGEPFLAEIVSAHGRPLLNSPAIDAGILVDVLDVLPGIDLLGNPRIRNALIDIGAYEYTPTESIVLSNPIPDFSIDEDFDAYVIPLENKISYPYGNKYLDFSIENVEAIKLLNASIKNRSIYVSPVKDRFGAQDIVLTVTDGVGSSLSDSFVIHINPVNDPPLFTISGNLLLKEDFDPLIDYGINFPISFGEEDQPYSYTLTPSPNFVNYSFSNEGQLTFASKTNLYGSENFTITINDGEESYSQNFDFAVYPVNDPPVINAVRSLSLKADEKKSISIGVSDVENDPIKFTVNSEASFLELNLTKNENNQYTLEVGATEFQYGIVTLAASDQASTTAATLEINPDLITGITDQLKEKIRVYPNPTNNFILIESNYLNEGRAVLYSLTGQPVYTTKIKRGNNKIEMDNLAKGLYILKVISGKPEGTFTYRIAKD